MKLIEAIKEANRPRAPVDSPRLRLACCGAVLVAVAAAASQGEIPRSTMVAAMALATVGSAFSYRTRSHPPGWIKVLAAIAAVTALVVFFEQIQGDAVAGVRAVQDPLTALFVWVNVIHCFHMPARRDLGFSVGGTAPLVAVAGAQAIDLRFAVFAAGWAALTLWALNEMWNSASGDGRTSWRAAGTAIGAVTVIGAAVFLVLPAPRVTLRVNLLSHRGFGGNVGIPGALAGDAADPTELAQPGSAAGKVAVGGYLGFADRLNTALPGKLSNKVVMRVRADRPSYWIGQTYDNWTGQDWVSTQQQKQPVRGASPFVVAPGNGEIALGQPDLQTFFVTGSTPDLVFHAETAQQVWFPADALFEYSDGTLVSPVGLGKGAVYTVESEVNQPSPAQLRAASAFTAARLPTAQEAEALQLPHPYPQAQALAESVTAGATSTYDKVEALIAWMGAHTRYSTDIPALPPGADTVNQFLFTTRVGYCEQISTSLAVMLRSLGIPTREAVGYVPGPYNPITDLYDVQAKDAHAWVQVWFPGYGWQSFDPTASVPLANPSPGAAALHDIGHALGRIPVAPVAGVVVFASAVTGVMGYWRRRPATWAERVARDIERAGARSGRPRRAEETIIEYAKALDALETGPPGPRWGDLAEHVSAAGYRDGADQGQTGGSVDVDSRASPPAPHV